LEKPELNPIQVQLLRSIAHTEEVKANFKPGEATYQEVCLAGRLMSKRIMGKASFADCRMHQVESNCIYLEMRFVRVMIKRCTMMHLKNGLTSVILSESKDMLFILRWANVLSMSHRTHMLSKSLKPLPVVKKDDEGNVFDAFTDLSKDIDRDMWISW
jgi:lysyl-tRNA synthetase class 2